jgi:hypothetical protein
MRREHRRSRWLIAAALAVLLWGSLGASCEDVILQPEEATGPPAALRVVADQGTVFWYRGGFVALVDIVVITDQPFQAWNLRFTWDSDTIYIAGALPHPEFDDDGSLFESTQFGANALSNIVDLRHGSSALVGTVRVARVVFVSSTTEPVKVRALGEIAAPDGTHFSVVVSEFATFGL